MAEREGFEPSGPLSQAAFLAGMWFKPNSPTSPGRFILPTRLRVTGRSPPRSRPRASGDYTTELEQSTLQESPCATFVSCSQGILQRPPTRLAVVSERRCGRARGRAAPVARHLQDAHHLPGVRQGQAHGRHRQSRLHALVRQQQADATAKGTNRPSSTPSPPSLGVAKSNVKWVVRTLRLELRARAQEVRLRHQRDLLHRRPRQGRHLLGRATTTSNQSIVVAQDQRDRASTTRPPSSRPTSTATRSARRASRTSTTTSSPRGPARVYSTLAERSWRCRPSRSTPWSSTRPPGSTWRPRRSSTPSKQAIGAQVGQFPSVGEHYGLLFQKGNPLVALRQRRDQRRSRPTGQLEGAADQVARDLQQRSRPLSRRPRVERDRRRPRRTRRLASSRRGERLLLKGRNGLVASLGVERRAGRGDRRRSSSPTSGGANRSASTSSTPTSCGSRCVGDPAQGRQVGPSAASSPTSGSSCCAKCWCCSSD